MTSFRRILVAIDFSSQSRVALAAAVRLAKGGHGSVELVHVLPFARGVRNAALALASLARDGGRARRRALDHGREALDRWRRRTVQRGVPAEKHLLLGRPAEGILAAVRFVEPDVIVMGTRGIGGARGLLLGSVASEIVRTAPLPVIVTRGRRPTFKRILVADDFSHGSDQALRAALALPAEPGARVLLVHVIDTHPTLALGVLGLGAHPDARAIEKERRRLGAKLDARAARLGRRGLRVECRVVAGSPAGELARAAQRWRAGLLVAATHGQSGLRRALLGSTTEALLRVSPCPVLAVKPLDWKPPVR
jgi:universal stress protein E